MHLFEVCIEFSSTNKYVHILLPFVEIPNARIWIRKTMESEGGFYFITRCLHVIVYMYVRISNLIPLTSLYTKFLLIPECLNRQLMLRSVGRNLS